ncbi:MAG TPA: cytochrome b N-terminal domain-containing protein [Candidatus Polarisedimenticolia bacterium]|nr:cytochrome b N-terminal domain-containing protein [Candidatus Polarisedimenticolia bacterium]
MLRTIALWIDERLHLSKLFASTAGHTVPASAGSWFYVFGSGTLLCFVLQIVTGICLAFVYVPSADEAYTSLEYLNYQQPLGWYLRALHYWGSNFMVGIMAVHMTQVFLFGAFKYPRELTWISGCILLLLTLGMAFTGQIMRFDQDAYWGLGIGASIMGRTPFIGSNLVHLLLAGPIIAGETLSRFFTLHVFVIPGLLIALISLHLRLVLTKGINEYPVPRQEVRKETYAEEYEVILKKEGVPFYPKAIDKDLIFSGLVVLGILFCAAYFGPKGPKGIPDPTQIRAVPAPDFFFLWIYAALALLPPYMETFLLLTAPVVGIVLLFAIPFISNTGEKSARRRPVAVLGVLLVFLTLGTLTQLGTYAPWSPQMEAWSGAPTPVQYVQGRSPLELQGALVLQSKQCRNCHSLGGEGGLRGPALDGVATRLTPDQLIRQVIQGGGNMPAYGKNLSPQEVTALVAFMQTLRSEHAAAARDSTR